MPPVRILFVDDEPSIRATTPLVLKSHGYDTTSVGTVAEALAEIAAHPFDVLISDLNMGEYGDGFTVVSAMRRTHPNCINFILTGYPALETALEVISRHVDEILVKPLPPPRWWLRLSKGLSHKSRLDRGLSRLNGSQTFCTKAKTKSASR